MNTVANTVADPPSSTESAREEALHDLHVLDIPPEERFDRIARLARTMFAVPMAAVDLVDAHRQQTKAEVSQVLMPHTVPALPGCEPAGRCVPAHSIGGDVHAWHTLPDGDLPGPMVLSRSISGSI